VPQKFGETAKIYRCQHWKTLYLPNPDEAPPQRPVELSGFRAGSVMRCPLQGMALRPSHFFRHTKIVARSNKSFMMQVGTYMSLAMLLPIASFTGYAIGYYLDKAFHTHFLYIVFLLLGIASGFVQLIRQFLRDTRDDGA
jgi:hypothetical protein